MYFVVEYCMFENDVQMYCCKSIPTWSLTVVSSDSLMTFNAKSTEKMHEHVLIIL